MYLQHTKWAPVVITVYNRINHLKSCIESLKKCDGAEKTTVYIALDYPLEESGIDIHQKIKEYVQSINGFENIVLFARESNLGTLVNSALARRDVFNLHDRLIMMEEDNIVSEDFLIFQNTALDFYEQNPKIQAVCGYTYIPIQKLGSSKYDWDVFMWKGISMWGVGLWRDKWKKLNFPSIGCFLWSYNWLTLKNIIKSRKVGHHYFPGILRMLKKQTLHGDTYFSLKLLEDSNYCIFPFDSKVKNNGYDGSGVNCEVDLLFNDELGSPKFEKIRLPQNIYSPEKINSELYQYFKRSYLSLIYNIIKLISVKIRNPKFINKNLDFFQ